MQDIEVVLIKLWRSRNVMLMNESQPVRRRPDLSRPSDYPSLAIAAMLDPAQFIGAASRLVL